MSQTLLSNLGEKLKKIQQNQWVGLGILPIVLLLSYLAHQSFKGLNLWGGLRWLGLGSLLLMVFTPIFPSKPYPEKRQLGVSRGWRRIAGIIGLVIGVGLILSSGQEFLKTKPGEFPTQDTWNDFLLGVVFWIAGGALLTCAIPKKIVINQATAAFLQLLLFIAIFLRIYELKDIPNGIWYDEALALLDARRMLNDANFRPFFVPNITYPHLMLYAQALRVFGDTNVAGPRLVHVFFGVAAVVSAFLVGDLLRGRWFGLLMGFFMAVFSWSITFSRIAMTGVETCFFTLLTFYFLMRMVRYGQMRDALWAGLTAGVGLYFYAAFRFALIPLLIYGLIAWRWWKPQALLMTGFGAITALLVFMPILVFYKLDPDLYTNRSKEVSVFREENRLGVSLEDALDISVDRHLRMFHVLGDRNGRHNLPFDPMVDVITGVVFVLGIGLSLRHLNHAEEWFFIGLFIASLASGLVTLHHEAPQGLRTIGILPAIAYFSALTLEEIGQILIKAKLRPVAIGVLSILLATTLYLNYDKYFERQARNQDVWLSHSTFPTITGQLMRARPDHRFYISPWMYGEPNMQFLVPDYQQHSELVDFPDTLPLRIPPPAGPITLILHFSERLAYEYAQVLYPNAKFTTITSSDYGVRGDFAHDPVMYVIDLTPEDITAIQGLNEDGSGVLYAPQYSEYRFFTTGQLMIDGEVWPSGEGRLLAKGNHAIQITPGQGLEWEVRDYTVKSGVPNWMLYHGPVTSNGLHGYFYANTEWSGSPALERIDPFLDVYFHKLPMPRPYTVIWKGFLNVPTDGVYGIGLRVLTSGEVSLDGVLLVSGSDGSKPITTMLELKAGRHPIEVRLLDVAYYSRIHLVWSLDNGETYEPIPRDVLTPY